MALPRLLEIVNLLLVNEKLSAKYLADYFDVSIRTIYRDLDKLTLANIPVYTVQGKQGGISLLPDYKLNKQLLSKDDQHNIINALHAIPIQASKEALTKLSALFDIRKRDWIEIDFKPWYELEKTDIFSLLRDSILMNNMVEFGYVDMYGNVSLKKVCPYKIYFKSHGWYLSAYDTIKEKKRIYKITRMSNIKKLEEFNIEVFDRDDFEQPLFYDNDCSSQDNQVKIVLKIANTSSYRIFDEFSLDEIEYHKEYYIVRFQSEINEWLKSHLLSYQTDLEILEPKILKDDLKKLLLEIYEKI